MPITGTTTKTQANLDFGSALSLAYAGAWLAHHGRIKFPSSAVIRRALQVYIAHLRREGIEPAAEFRAVRSVCSAALPDEEAKEAAQQRLQAAVGAKEMPSFQAVRYGPQFVAEMAALEARVEGHMQVIAESPWGRLRGITA